jgi:hypothetical protein
MRIGRLKLIVLLLPMMTGCLRHTRVSQQPEFSAPVPSPNVLQLVETINRRYDQISSLTATLEVAVTVGGTHPGEVTDYAPCPGYLLFRKPYGLRVLILVPVLHTHAVDLASDGMSFTLLIPPRNRAIEGNNTVTKSADNPLENLRPNVFVDTIMIREISSGQMVSVIHEVTSKRNAQTNQVVELPEYDLTVFGEAPVASSPALAKVAKPERVIHFRQFDLLPIGQDIYSTNGELETQVVYGADGNFDGVAFPSTIDINRPMDKYRIHLTIDKLTVNQPLADESFELKIPGGMQVQRMQ